MIAPPMQVVGIGGYAGSGKDTAAQALVASGWVRMAFADLLRDALYVLNPLVTTTDRLQDIVDEMGWDNAKRALPEIRRLLQVLGTEVGRKQWADDFWVDLLFKNAKEQGVDQLVISDVRFPNEIAAVNKALGFTLWIQRDGVGPVNGHASDNSLDATSFSRVIHNNGSVADLQDTVLKAVAAHDVQMSVLR